MEYTCIIPCYNSEHTVEEVVDGINDFFNKAGEDSYEIICVNDCSKDNTIGVIKNLAQKHEHLKAVDLAKNSGQHNALLAGMSIAQGNYVISIDDDNQTHPDQIAKLIEKINEGYDVVYGKYETMKQSTFRNLGAAFNDWTIRILTGKPDGLKASSFWIAKRFVVDKITESQSVFTNLQGLFLRTTDKIVNTQVEHHARQYGKSNYTLKKLIKLWSSCLNYSYLPMQLILGVGAGSLALSGLLIILILLGLLFGRTVGSFGLLFLSMLIMFSLIMIALGVIAAYLSRMFMIISKEPQYIIRDIYE